ncbi:MAG: hypothetical protein O9335_13785 [Inhella sp.]|jgi:hypothetical protein|uniref:hypothetical protein n=1 Tax=Inhella sp. TaxID=1921806 RepID=UPI0022BF3737|nr:hypothetical protein [Inhella sp.]MCZ8236216.1 hypothetical protein [Inhella sp.]
MNSWMTEMTGFRTARDAVRVAPAGWSGRARAVLVAVGWGLAAAGGMAGTLQIEGRWRDDGTLQVSYTPPDGVRTLELNHTPEVKAWWGRQVMAADSCTVLEGLTLRLAAGCRRATLRVQPQLLAANAQYEPAQPVGDPEAPVGVVAFLGAYAAPVAGHGLRWVWHPPQGGEVLWQGRWAKQRLTQWFSAKEVDAALAQRQHGGAWLSAVGAHQMAYLGRAPSQSFGAGRLVWDPRLDADRRTLILDTLTRTTARLTRAYGVGMAGPAGVVVALSDRPGYHGDTDGGRMMRLRLAQTARDGDAGWLRGFVSHEVVHWWNAGRYTTDHTEPWLHEGHAEWMALLLGLEQGWMDLATVQRAAQGAVQACVDLAGGLTLAQMAANRNQGIYTCGVALLVLAQAHRRAAEPGVSLVEQLASLHRLDPHLSRRSLVAWGGAQALAPWWLGPEQALGPPLRHHLEQLGLFNRQTVAEAALSPRDSQQWLGALMAADCQGVSFYSFDHEVQLAPNGTMRCVSWPLEGALRRIEGVPVFGRLASAHEALVRACATGPTYRLGFGDGSERKATCPATLPPAPDLVRWAVVPDAWRRLLSLAPAAP